MRREEDVPDPQPVAGRRVLVVDDDADIRMLVSTLFRSKGWTVEQAPNGHAALERAHETWDAILLDHRMPGITGFDVATTLRERGYAGTIIFYSAFVDRELEAKMRLDLDVDVHIVAKTDLPGLLKVIGDLS